LGVTISTSTSCSDNDDDDDDDDDGAISNAIAVGGSSVEVGGIESESIMSLFILTLFVGSTKVHNFDRVPSTGLATCASSIFFGLVGEGKGLLKYELRRSREGGVEVLVKTLKAEMSEWEGVESGERAEGGARTKAESRRP
jgi:hypothetical protein